MMYQPFIPMSPYGENRGVPVPLVVVPNFGPNLVEVDQNGQPIITSNSMPQNMFRHRNIY